MPVQREKRKRIAEFWKSDFYNMLKYCVLFLCLLSENNNEIFYAVLRTYLG